MNMTSVEEVLLAETLMLACKMYLVSVQYPNNL